MNSSTYQQRVESQIRQYAEPSKLLRLPPIYSYWSQKYVGPKVQAVFGERNLYTIYAHAFQAALSEQLDTRNLLSLGCGEGNVDIEIAKAMLAQGLENFHIDCLDLSELRINRARERSAAEKLDRYLHFAVADLNDWHGQRQYAGVYSHHTLHHMANLVDRSYGYNFKIEEPRDLAFIDFSGAPE